MADRAAVAAAVARRVRTLSAAEKSSLSLKSLRREIARKIGVGFDEIDKSVFREITVRSLGKKGGAARPQADRGDVEIGQGACRRAENFE